MTFSLWAMHKESWFGQKAYIIEKTMGYKKAGFKFLMAKQIMYFFSLTSFAINEKPWCPKHEPAYAGSKF